MLIAPIEKHSTNRLVAGIPLLFVLCSYIYHYSTELFIPRLILIFTAICTAIFENAMQRYNHFEYKRNISISFLVVIILNTYNHLKINGYD